MSISRDKLMQELDQLVHALRDGNHDMAQAGERLFELFKQTSPIATKPSSSCTTTCPHCKKSVVVTLS